MKKAGLARQFDVTEKRLTVIGPGESSRPCLLRTLQPWVGKGFDWLTDLVTERVFLSVVGDGSCTIGYVWSRTE